MAGLPRADYIVSGTSKWDMWDSPLDGWESPVGTNLVVGWPMSHIPGVWGLFGMSQATKIKIIPQPACMYIAANNKIHEATTNC